MYDTKSSGMEMLQKPFYPAISSLCESLHLIFSTATVVPIPKSLLCHYEYGKVLVIPFMVAIFQNQMQLTKTKTVCQALDRSMCKFIWSNSIPDIFMAIGDSLDRNLFVAHILHFTSFAIKILFLLCRLIRYTSPHTELQSNAHKKNRPFFPVFQSRAKWMSKNQRLTQPHCSAELGMSMHIAELGNCSGLNIFAWLHYFSLFCSMKRPILLDFDIIVSEIRYNQKQERIAWDFFLFALVWKLFSFIRFRSRSI